jgi:GT2 family glycosyltransferase
MGAPAISVLMPVRNGERFIAEAVESVLTQSFGNLELVVVDDGSTDSTPEILEQIASRDPRLVIRRREPGHNLTEVRNFAAACARAPLLAPLDADDVALPDRLQSQTEFLATHPEVVLLGGQALLIDGSGREFGKAEYPTTDHDLRVALQKGNQFVHSSTVFRRDAFEAVGGYRTNFEYAEDFDLYLRLAEVGRMANLPNVVVGYRLHGDQETFQKKPEEQAVFSAAASASARARAGGREDPFDDVKIDEAYLIAHGLSKEEITASVVASATWLARTTNRAGDSEGARRLFEGAYAKARSESGSPALVASVHRSLATGYAEQGHVFRAKLKAAQARLVERGWRT